MTTLYLIRHCLTEGNLAHKMQGSTDEPLCDQGLKQLPFLTEHFRSIPIDAVYASDFKRAIQTAEAVAIEKGLRVRLDHDLREREAGNYEGITVRELLALTGADVNVGGPRFPGKFDFPTGERIYNVYDRIRLSLDRITQTHPDGAVAVVSHGMALQMAFAYYERISLDTYVSRPIYNGSVTKVLVDSSNRGKFEYFGDVSFFPEEFLEFAKMLERK